MEQAKTTPIAITGMACRFPGQADTPERLWDICAAAQNTWSEWPKDRLNESAFSHPQPEHLGTFHSNGGHFLTEDVSLWDASFFNFTADMAKAMDPQVRLLLETAFEAFQTAGLPLEKLAGSQTAVFAGSMFRDYHDLLMRDAENLPRYHVTGNAAAFTANRLSHFFDLRGPSVSVDTACSTTLAALHLACQSLRTGESSTAVVGGSNLILHPGSSMSLSNLGLTGRAGKSFSFDSRAQGYGRGEGVACIVLKPLADALRDGDPVRAVIRETGMNQDGRTQTITTPSPEAQKQLILSCYERAGLDPRDTTYVEAHGTGTIAGDKIELGALGATIGKERSAKDPFYVGSVKANFGHTESTSGLAAVIKVAMMLEHGQIPPQALFEKHNPRIDFEALNIKIPTELLEWPDSQVRRASISNFGAGGANTHVIMEDPRFLLGVDNQINGEATSNHGPVLNGSTEANGHHPFDQRLDTNGHRILNGYAPTSGSCLDSGPATNGVSTTANGDIGTEVNGDSSTEVKKATNGAHHGNCTDIDTENVVTLSKPNKAQAGVSCSVADESLIFTLSARDETSLRASARRVADYLGRTRLLPTVHDLAYTLNQKRTHFPWRLAVNAATLSTLRETLSDASLRPLNSPQVPRLGFVFTGQGAQWFAMGRELIAAYPKFREALEDGASYMRSLGADWDPIEELGRSAEDTKLNHPYLSFPMSVLLQLALVRLLRSWGILPTATTGHSSGEIAAAYASGGLTFNEAVAVAYIRGRLTSDFVESGRARGGMTAVATSKEKAREYFGTADVGTTAVIACVNSPNSVTISGDIPALEKIEALAGHENLMFRRLKVPAAYHSSEMEALAEDYLNALKPHFDASHPQAFEATFSSPVTGGIVKTPASIHDPSHWVRNMVQPVLFDDSLKVMVSGQKPTTRKNITTAVDFLLEIGPHGTLQGPIRQILDSMSLQSMKTSVGACLKRGDDATKTIKEMANTLYCKGYPVDLESVNFPRRSRPCKVVHDLPTYQWNHSVGYWDVPHVAVDYMQRKHPRHDLLGTRVEGLNPEQAIWRNTIRISDLPWLQHHVVQSEILYPAAGLLVMVTEAMRQLDEETGKSSHGYALKSVDLSKAVIIPGSGDSLELQLVIKEPSSLSADDTSARGFVFYSRAKGTNWTKHCQGNVSSAENVSQAVPVGGLSLIPMDVGHFYRSVERSGPTLGPTFRNVTRLSGGELMAEATITVPDTVAMMPSSFASECLVHPTTLDACFHPAWAALPTAVLRNLGLSVPRTIQNLFISSNAPTAPGTELGLRVSMEEATTEGFRVSMSIYSLEDLDRIPIIRIDGLSMVSISECSAPLPTDELMLLHTDWQPSLHFLSPDDLQTRIIESPDPSEAVVFHELQQATINVIHDELGKLSSQDEDNLEWYHKKFVTWMRDQDTTFYRSMAVTDEQRKLDLYSRVTQSCVNGRMLDLVKRNLSSFLKKKADPLEVMAKDGFLSEYYANMIKLTRCLHHVEKYMKLFAHENPGARILEIGAGTGSCTEPALQGLSQDGKAPLLVEKYVFTDVSAGFFEAAGRRFEPYANQMQFQKLDIERDPLDQGFEEGDYDLIISCNCLHATGSLQRTLGNVRKLLKPGGKLLLLETTTPHVDQSLTFGLFSGWWLSEEEERKDSPLLSAPAWSRFLSESGFTGVDVALGDAGSAEISNYSAMVATAADHTDTNGVMRSKNVALIPFPSAEAMPKEWLESLEATLGDITEANVSVVVDSERLTDDLSAACVLAVGDESLASMASTKFEFLQRVLLKTENVMWVSHGAAAETVRPSASLHTGLLRTLRMEQGEDKYVSLDLDPERDVFTEGTIKAICDVFYFSKHSHGIRECELAERAGKVLVPRLRRIPGLAGGTVLSNEPESTQITASIERVDVQIEPNAGYVVVGGMTGIGREIVRWLARKGAKNIILLSRSADVSRAQNLQAELLSVGSKLIPYATDIASKNDLERFIGALKIIMPIRGVVQSALVLNDSSFTNMTLDQWEVPLGPKYHGSKNLDELFHGPDLDFFIMLSSVTGILGSHGQSNYTAGSTYQDALARSRVARGLPGVSIDLGSVLGAGYVARTTGVAERAGKAGWRAHTVQEVLYMVELAIKNPRQPEIVAGIAPWSESGQLSWRQEARFAALPLRLEASKTPQKGSSTVSLRDQLQAAESKIDTMVDGLTNRLAEMFVLSPADINHTQPLAALGVDSLVAVELRNWLSATVTPNVTIFDVTQSGSLVELAEKVVRKFA
ncbi:hypothetical protein AB5N19_01715 [Seiridium cardinale]